MVNRAVKRTTLQQRHLMFLGYIWAFTPFLLIWLATPGMDQRMGKSGVVRLQVAATGVLIYLVCRTVVALKGPSKLRWDLIFSFVDALAASLLIWAGGREPVSSMAALYLLAIVEVSESMSIPWILAVAGVVTVGEAVATWNHRLPDPFSQIYPYVFIFFAGSVSGLLARTAARNRELLAVAQDRERIAFEMHDGVQGHLVTISSQLELLGHTTRTDPDLAENLAGEAKNLARLAADELRYLVLRLKSPSMGDGFGTSLTQFAYNLTARNHIDLEVDLPKELSLRPEIEHGLFRIAQEAMTNSIRHGQPSKMEIRMVESQGRIEMTIQDDGVGFDVDRVDDPSKSGLQSMRSRAESFGGEFSIRSATAEGVAVTVRVPLS